MKNILQMMIIILFLPSRLWAENLSNDKVKEFAELHFSSVIEEYNIPGLAIGVTFDGKHYFYNTGNASKETDTPVTQNTLFELGSVSKIFNVTLAAMAEQRGLIDLNLPVSVRIPELNGSAFGNLTLMNLATHSSGGNLPLQVPNDVNDVNELINWLVDWKPSFQNGRSYSNISIGLLGHITANAMGKSYKQALEDDLLPEMGLQNTWVDVPDDKAEHYAFGYDRKTNAPIRVNPGVLDDEAYGVKSSARDMIKLLDLELGHPSVSPELKESILRTHQGHSNTKDYTQAMIWEKYPWPIGLDKMMLGNDNDYILNSQPIKPVQESQQIGNFILNKTGSTNGFGAYIVVVPVEDIGVVVLANRNYPNTERVRATYGFIQSMLEFAQ